MGNFHVNDSQDTHRYYMILGHDIFSQLNIDLCFSNNTIRGGEVTYKGCNATMKKIENLILTKHLIGFKTNCFGKHKYGKENICLTPRGICIAS